MTIGVGRAKAVGSAIAVGGGRPGCGNGFTFRNRTTRMEVPGLCPLQSGTEKLSGYRAHHTASGFTAEFLRGCSLTKLEMELGRVAVWDGGLCRDSGSEHFSIQSVVPRPDQQCPGPPGRCAFLRPPCTTESAL